jgi:hypothetical protein
MCKGQRACELQSEAEVVERAERAAHMYSAKSIHPQDNQNDGAHKSVWFISHWWRVAFNVDWASFKLRRLGVELSTSIVDRRTIVGEHRSVRRRRGGRKWRGRVSVETRTQKYTRMTQPKQLMVGGRNARTQATARVSHLLEHSHVSK